MHKLLSAFILSTKDMNKFKKIILHLRKNGKTADDFVEYVNQMVEEERVQRAKVEKKSRQIQSHPCPECKTFMNKEPVNNSPRTMTGDDSKIVYSCLNPKCMHQIFE